MMDDLNPEESVPDEGTASDTPTLEEQLSQAVSRADENYQKFLLATADFDNFKKRMQRDRELHATAYRRGLIEHFLPVFDNLERALQSDGSGDGLRNGLEQTLRGFQAVLSGQGVKELEVANRPFDPRLAEAIGTQVREDVADGTVVEVVQKGYGLGDDLIRPARVIVAEAPG